jgi:hypothetical protein
MICDCQHVLDEIERVQIHPKALLALQLREIRYMPDHFHMKGHDDACLLGVRDARNSNRDRNLLHTTISKKVRALEHMLLHRVKEDPRRGTTTYCDQSHYPLQ